MNQDSPAAPRSAPDSVQGEGPDHDRVAADPQCGTATPHCAYCGEPLGPRRPRARYCSARCRAAASVERRITAAVDRALAERDRTGATTVKLASGMVGSAVSELLVDPECVADVPIEGIPRLLEGLERLRTLLLDRLRELRPSATPRQPGGR